MHLTVQINISSKAFLLLNYIGAFVNFFFFPHNIVTSNPAIMQMSCPYGHHFMQTKLSTGPGMDKGLNNNC